MEEVPYDRQQEDMLDQKPRNKQAKKPLWMCLAYRHNPEEGKPEVGLVAVNAGKEAALASGRERALKKHPDYVLDAFNWIQDDPKRISYQISLWLVGEGVETKLAEEIAYVLVVEISMILLKVGLEMFGGKKPEKESQ